VFLEKNIIKKGQARQDRREARRTCLRGVPVCGRRQAGVTAMASSLAGQEGMGRAG